MVASMQTMTAVLKERYEGKLREQLNNETVALKRVYKGNDNVTTEVGGKYATFPIHTRRNAGIGARNEGEQLPIPGAQGTAAARVQLRYLYGGIELTGPVFALAETNAQAFISAVDLETNGLKTDLAKDLNRQVYGDGTGTIAKTTATSTANVLTVDNTMFFGVNMMVDLFTGNTIKAQNRQIVDINDAAKTITLNGPAITAAIGDRVVRTGNNNREWLGFNALFGTGKLFNIDPADEPVWKSTIAANGGVARAISEVLMITAINEARRRGGKPSVIFTSPGVWTSYFQLLSQQRTFVNTKEFAGGFSGLSFATDNGEIPVVQDFDCPAGTMYAVDESDLKVYRESDWSFMSRDGNMWDRRPGFDAYNATMYQYSQLGIGRRNGHVVIKDLIETVLT